MTEPRVMLAERREPCIYRAVSRSAQNLTLLTTRDPRAHTHTHSHSYIHVYRPMNLMKPYQVTFQLNIKKMVRNEILYK